MNKREDADSIVRTPEQCARVGEIVARIDVLKAAAEASVACVAEGLHRETIEAQRMAGVTHLPTACPCREEHIAGGHEGACPRCGVADAEQAPSGCAGCATSDLPWTWGELDDAARAWFAMRARAVLGVGA